MAKAAPRRRGGVAVPATTTRIDDNTALIVVTVWHWLWFAPLCNWRNRHRHGWDFQRYNKSYKGLREYVTMSKTWERQRDHV